MRGKSFRFRGRASGHSYRFRAATKAGEEGWSSEGKVSRSQNEERHGEKTPRKEEENTRTERKGQRTSEGGRKGKKGRKASSMTGQNL